MKLEKADVHVHRCNRKDRMGMKCLPINIFDVYKNGGNLNDVYDQPFFEAIRDWQDKYAYR